MFQLPVEEPGKRYVYKLSRFGRSNIIQIELKKETEKSWMVYPKTAKSLLHPGGYISWIPQRIAKKSYYKMVFDTAEEAWGAILERVNHKVQSAKEYLEKAETERESAYKDKVAWDCFMTEAEWEDEAGEGY